MSNRLKQETSPYLLQHAENPVDWYPWCEEAFERARQEDKPVFLSIGYSTCHWCHVMARESFEQKAVADRLQKGFIAVKVDREERPDIDSVYMSVCQAFTGSGGWPMSIFMTWDKKPFFAGTYFPPESRYGMPGFLDLLTQIEIQWRENRAGLLAQAERIMEHVQGRENGKRKEIGQGQELEQETEGKETGEEAVQLFARSFDSLCGGFGTAPKFPTPHNLLFLLFYAYLERKKTQRLSMGEENTEAGAVLQMVEKTLVQMRRGGIFDQIGGGFSRYSTDRQFLAPHFEKMLYDNALLILAYAAAYRMTGKSPYLETAKETADYVLREMTLPEGGFYSAQDADSEGVEGGYYTFTLQEVLEVLGKKRGMAFAAVFDITREGNFNGEQAERRQGKKGWWSKEQTGGANIPNLLKSGQMTAERLGKETETREEDFQEEKQLLYEYRKKRMPLHLDDKVLYSWNAMMITAFAMLSRVSGEERYLQTARKAQAFLEEHLWQKEAAGQKETAVQREAAGKRRLPEESMTGQREPFQEEGQGAKKGCRLAVSWRNGRCMEKGFLDDYAYGIAALLELYQATLEKGYLEKAELLCQETVARFGDGEGFFLCERGEGELFFNPKEVYDGAIPSGNSVMAYNLVRLYQLTGQETYGSLAKRQLSFLSTQAEDYPAGHSLFLLAKLLYENPQEHVIIVTAFQEQPPGERVTEEQPPEGLSLLANLCIVKESAEYPLLNQRTTYYICKDFQCLPPRN